MSRPRGASGRALHGSLSLTGGAALFFGSGRPGGREGCGCAWVPIGNGSYCDSLGQCSMQVGHRWNHARNILLKNRSCLASASSHDGTITTTTACVTGMFKTFLDKKSKDLLGTRARAGFGHRSRTGRYPSSRPQVRGLVTNATISGSVLDLCGAAGDAACVELVSHGLVVTTNDIDRRLQADSYLDASTGDFGNAFMEGERRPDWMVTNPPYKNAIDILRQALQVARVGVAFKLRLSLLEPTKTRGSWLKDNPPHALVALPRACYYGRQSGTTEACFGWRMDLEDSSRSGRSIFFVE